MTGRPTTFTEEMAAEICFRLMEGQSLRAVCRAEDMPARSTVHKWLAEIESFTDQYARACMVRADDMFDEMFEVADDSSNDWMERAGRDGENIGWQVNGEAVQRSKLRVDTRKWALARMNPKKYGDRLALSDPDGGPLRAIFQTTYERAPSQD